MLIFHDFCNIFFQLFLFFCLWFWFVHDNYINKLFKIALNLYNLSRRCKIRGKEQRRHKKWLNFLDSSLSFSQSSFSLSTVVPNFIKKVIYYQPSIWERKEKAYCFFGLFCFWFFVFSNLFFWQKTADTTYLKKFGDLNIQDIDGIYIYIYIWFGPTPLAKKVQKAWK